MSTRNTIQTKYGPLCRAWGDATPATVADVTVRVNGVPVVVSAVNPYTGLITLAVPITLTAPGTDTVEVDYCWFPSAAVQLATLNTPGLVLNKWDGAGRGTSHTGTDTPNAGSGTGVADRSRYVMGVALGPPKQRPQPKQIGHRFLAVERAYSAVLNSPTTLRLNQNPNSTANYYVKQTPTPVAVNYIGSQNTPDVFGWEQTGSMSSASNPEGYTLRPATATAPAFWTQDVDTSSFPASVQIVSRVSVPSDTVTLMDGVWTGTGFGFHNNRYLYLVGFLKINDLFHLGMLLDPETPYSQGSWQIGPAIPITITGSNTFLSPTGYTFADGSTFQVFTGSQVGIYTVATCGTNDGVTTINESFPDDYTLEGNRDITVYLAIDTDTAQTYRLVSNVRTGAADVYIGGALSGAGIQLNEPVALKGAAYTSLLLPPTKKGAMFFGSPCRQAISTSMWQFVKYGVQYDQTSYPFSGLVANTSATVLPEQCSPHPWFVTEDFGYAQLTAGTKLLVKNTVGSDILDTRFGYARIEPFLSSHMLTDMDCTVRVESTSGSQDTILIIENQHKLVRLGVLCYLDGVGSGDSFRRLVSLPPAVCLTGLSDPDTDGWTGVSVLTQTLLENRVVLEQTATAQGTYTQQFDISGSLDHASSSGRIFEARLLVQGASGLSVTSGPRFGGRFSSTGRDVQVALTTSPTRVKLLSAGAPVASYVFDWADGQYHTYRVLCDEGSATVSLVVDDTVIGTEAYAGFTALGSIYQMSFGTGVASAVSTSYWASFSGLMLPPTAAKRTFGIAWADSPSSINDWVVPRTDSSRDQNSNSAAIIEEMDWQADCQLRVRLDPGWGVTVFRPDLAAPPYYSGGFITEYTQPTAGWINLEYADLPLSGTDMGRVMFGSLTPESVSQQRWGADSVRYRIYAAGQTPGAQNRKMVLNYYNVITSGELNRDITVETVELESLDSTHVLISPCHMYADRVYTVVVNNTVLASTEWTFDKTAQLVTLNSPLSGAHVPVTVNFVAGRPVSNTYLQTQPIMQSIGLNLLNEDTPPVPWSQVGSAIRSVVFGGTVVDPTPSADYIVNTDYRQVTFTDDPNVLYSSLEKITVSDTGTTGLITPIWDGPAATIAGLVDIALSGDFFSDVGAPVGLAGQPRQGSRALSGLRDTVGGFDQSVLLIAAGGSRNGAWTGVLNQAPLYPSYPAVGWRRGAINQSLTWSMTVGADTLFDDMSGLLALADNVPATYGDGRTVDPYGVAGAMSHGACVAVLTDYTLTTYSRIGPWAGDAALAVRSYLAGGGYPLSGNALTCAGGASLGVGPVVTTYPLEAAN